MFTVENLKNRQEPDEPLKEKQPQKERDDETQRVQRDALAIKEMMEYKAKWEASQKEMEA